MTLHAGTVANFSGSLAEQIETAFASELLAVKGVSLPDYAKQERRILFCAIAQGVLKYMAANPDAFEVQLTFTGSDPTGGDVQLQVVT
ncbi:MAG TPA: hypothetical protein VGH24_06165 [Solirubrobacteraceae bacterium]